MPNSWQNGYGVDMSAKATSTLIPLKVNLAMGTNAFFNTINCSTPYSCFILASSFWKKCSLSKRQSKVVTSRSRSEFALSTDKRVEPKSTILNRVNVKLVDEQLSFSLKKSSSAVPDCSFWISNQLTLSLLCTLNSETRSLTRLLMIRFKNWTTYLRRYLICSSFTGFTMNLW